MSIINIIGNGPSLNEINKDVLFSQNNTVSFNRMYIIYDEYNFYPKYYFCIDKTVLLNCLDDIIKLINMNKIEEFCLLKCNETIHLKNNSNVTLIKPNENNRPYFGDVATFAIYYLSKKGFKEMNVYGCDCNYIEDYEKLNVNVEYNNNDPARRIILKPKQDSKDPNHFIDNYFDHTCEYSVPRMNNHLKCWKNIKEKLHVNINFKTTSKASKFFK